MIPTEKLLNPRIPMRQHESASPFLIGGILLALVLIGTFLFNPPNQAVLSRQFTAQPPDPSQPTLAPFELPQVRLPDLPVNQQTTIADITQKLAKGQAIPALTPEAKNTNVQVSVSEIRRSGERVSIRGNLKNIGSTDLQVAPAAFLFRDSLGVSYSTEGTGATTLQPGQQTPFDLTVPLPSGRGLTLIVDLPPDPPLEQVLVVEVR
jgi:hypothetical protein